MFQALIFNENLYNRLPGIQAINAYFPLTDYPPFDSPYKSYQVINITGLNPPKTQLNFIKTATTDGAIFNSGFVDTRNIVIYLRINDKVDEVCEKINYVCQLKETVKFYYKTGDISVYIEGYVDSIEYNHFDKGIIAQISLICPDPNFKSDTENTFTRNFNGADVYSNFINNKVPIGILIQIAFNTSFNTSNIPFNLTISYGPKIEIRDLSILANDVLKISTYQNSIYAKIERPSSGNPPVQTINALPYITSDSNFNQLSVGPHTCTLAVTNDIGGTLTIKSRNEYIGV